MDARRDHRAPRGRAAPRGERAGDPDAGRRADRARRYATLVATEPTPSELLACHRGGRERVLGVPSVSLLRYGADRQATIVATFTEPGTEAHFGSTAEQVVARVMRSGKAQRIDDYQGASGPLAHRAEAWLPPPSPRRSRRRPAVGRARASTPSRRCRRTPSSGCATSPSSSRRRSPTPTRTRSSPRRARASSQARRRRAPAARAQPARRRPAAARRRSRSSCGWSRRSSAATRRRRGARRRARARSSTEALEELRELARGIHPAVLTERGLDRRARGAAPRAPLPVEVCERARAPAARAGRGGRLLRRRRGADQRRQVRQRDARRGRASTPRTGRCVVHESPTTAWAAPTAPGGPACAV